MGEYRDPQLMMTPTTALVFLLLAAPVSLPAQVAKEPTPEEFAKAMAEQVSVSKLRHATLDAVDRNKIPYLKDFIGLYPDSVVWYLSFAGADFPSLSVTATLYDRYEFNMRIPVRYSEDHRKVLGYGPPKCHLLEIESVDRRGDELGGRSGGDLQEHFGEEEWKSIVKSKGDFSVLGFELKKDAPVADFSLVIKHLKSLERKVDQGGEEGEGGAAGPGSK